MSNALRIVLPLVFGTACAAAHRCLAEDPPARFQGLAKRTAHIAVQNPVAWQAALDRAGFSPGVIDGLLGPKSRMALRAYQARAGLPVTGRPDEATGRSLGVESQPALTRYRLTPADAARVGPCPKDWIAKSRLKRLGYASLATLAAERGHCTLRLLAKLNPAAHLDALKPGDTLLMPNVIPPGPAPIASVLEIDFGDKVVRVLDESGSVVGMFHCSIAADRRRRPEGPCRVAAIAREPTYLFDPEGWPEITGVNRRLVIPPGPRNPVGLCWISLSIKGYGIHGTPVPELIGKTGSHGCFRLTNWDALRLAERVRPGTPVRFTEATAKTAVIR